MKKDTLLLAFWIAVVAFGMAGIAVLDSTKMHKPRGQDYDPIYPKWREWVHGFNGRIQENPGMHSPNAWWNAGNQAGDYVRKEKEKYTKDKNYTTDLSGSVDVTHWLESNLSVPAYLKMIAVTQRKLTPDELIFLYRRGHMEINPIKTTLKK